MLVLTGQVLLTPRLLRDCNISQSGQKPSMNVIRLTYAIEMIDDILDNGGDVSIQTAFQRALGTTNGNKVFGEVVKNNPSFSSKIARLQVQPSFSAEMQLADS
jgi:hypothetical protein